MKKLLLLIVFLCFSGSIISQEREVIAQSEDITIYESLVSKTSKNNLFPTFFKNGLIYNAVDKNEFYNPFYVDSILGKQKIKVGYRFRLGGMTTHENTIYFTGISKRMDANFNYNLCIYKGNLEKNKVSKIRKLDFCDPGFTYSHPTISSDGNKLMLVSNEKNQFHLLEFTKDEKGEWGQKKVVYIIHQSFDIINPTYFGDDTVYFSSNYYEGKIKQISLNMEKGKLQRTIRDMETGSFNIYKIERKKNHWSIPEKVIALSSESDDLGALFITEKSGYLTSYRYNNSDNIYYFELK